MSDSNLPDSEGLLEQIKQTIQQQIEPFYRLDDDQLKVAEICFRRWQSFSRRHKKDNLDLRINDLNKGLRQAFPEVALHDHPSDIRFVASTIATALWKNNG